MPLPVIVSYSNLGYIDFAKNMLYSMSSKLKRHKVHFYCLDSEIYEKLNECSFSNLDLILELVDSTATKDFQNYGSVGYTKITHHKIKLIKDALLKYGFIHFIDCDVVCVNEPSEEHYEKYRHYDIVFQYDCGMYDKHKLHHHLFTTWCCTGNMTLKNTKGTMHLLNSLLDYQSKHALKNDQECMLSHFKDLGIDDIRHYPQAKLYVYPIEEYTNGYWVDKDIGSLEKTFFFHANHVIGYQNKIQLLKKANCLYLFKA